MRPWPPVPFWRTKALFASIRPGLPNAAYLAAPCQAAPFWTADIYARRTAFMRDWYRGPCFLNHRRTSSSTRREMGCLGDG